MKTLSSILVGLVAVLVVAGSARSEAPEYQAARKAFQQWQDSVVTIKLVRKMRFAMRGRQMDAEERESEVAGTIVHESGLTVASLFACSPETVWAERMADQGYSLDSQIVQAKIVLADGKEIPGKVVLRDKDLDLIYIRPDDKNLKLKCLTIAKGPTLNVLDPIIILSRLDRSADRSPTVRVERVAAVIKKPRLMYALGMSIDSINNFGCPVLDSTGQPVGLMLVKLAPAAAGRSMVGSGMSAVVLPGEQVAKITQQALDAPEPVAAKEQAEGSEGAEDEDQDDEEIATLPPVTQPAAQP